MENLISHNKRLLFFFIVFIFFVFFQFHSISNGQEPDSLKMQDSSLIVDPSLMLDPSSMVDTSLIPNDTTELKPWEIVYADTIAVDTIIREPHLNMSDSLRLYFLSDRFDLSDQFVRSYGHDAGDYIKSNPSNFIIDYQPIPLRKTVSPFGLPGNRLDIIFGDHALHPLEHLPEPDNQIGFDEIPTVPVQKIYNIEGPLGKIFGGDNSISSLIMLPVQPKSSRAESELDVDVGNLGYANTKAVFTQQNKTGRLLQLAAEYRRSDGFNKNWGDSSYHHWADLIYPINNKINLKLNGRLYRRRGNVPFRPESTQNATLTRNRRDRDFSAGLDFGFSVKHNGSLEIRHQRSETETGIINRTYKRDMAVVDNSVHLSDEIILGKYLVRHELVLTEEEYHHFNYFAKRRRGKLNSTAYRGDSTSSVVGNLSLEKVDSYNPAPSFVLAFKKERESSYLALSAGYVTKFPRQYELALSPVVERILNSATNDYYESGNADLKPEKQLTGNITIAFGSKNNDWTISLTGGKIFDGIDWVPGTKDTNSLSLTSFITANHDIEFANLSITKRLSLGEKLFWTGAGSYRYVSIDGNSNPPYSPDYQFFTGLELYRYVELFDVHLYGYIETGFVGPFDTYPAFNKEITELGSEFVTNIKLSFRIKSFRFYYYWQNLFFTEYERRHNYGIHDRLVYYGLTWEFLD